MDTNKLLIAGLLAGGAFYLLNQKKEEETKEVAKDEQAIHAQVVKALEGVVEAINLGGLALSNPAWGSWKAALEEGRAKVKIEKVDKENYNVVLYMIPPGQTKLMKTDVSVRAIVKRGKKGARTVHLVEPSPNFKRQAHGAREQKKHAKQPSFTMRDLPPVAAHAAQTAKQTAVAVAAPVPPGQEKEVAGKLVGEALSAVRAGNTAPLNELLNQHLPSSAATAQRPNAMQNALGQAVMMQLMGFGMQLSSGVPLPDADLDYIVSLAAVLINHPQAHKLAREALKLGGSGPIDLAALAEEQSKEQIEKGMLTADTVAKQAREITATQKDMLNKIVAKAIDKGLLKRTPDVPGYNITFNDFVQKYNITPGTPPQFLDITEDMKLDDMAGIYGAYGAISSAVGATFNPAPANHTTRWGPVDSTATIPNADYLGDY